MTCTLALYHQHCNESPSTQFMSRCTQPRHIRAVAAVDAHSSAAKAHYLLPPIPQPPPPDPGWAERLRKEDQARHEAEELKRQEASRLESERRAQQPPKNTCHETKKRSRGPGKFSRMERICQEISRASRGACSVLRGCAEEGLRRERGVCITVWVDTQWVDWCGVTIYADWVEFM